MKIDKYAISIQYGEGFHHFETYRGTKEEALNYAESWKRRTKKGAKPKVHIWYLIDTFKKD